MHMSIDENKLKQAIMYRVKSDEIFSDLFKNTTDYTNYLAVHLALKYFKGVSCHNGSESYSFEANGKKYLIRSRILKDNSALTLSVIRKIDEFDVLVVIIFNKDYSTKEAFTITNEEAKKLCNGHKNAHENGYKLSVGKRFREIAKPITHIGDLVNN